MPGIGTGVKQQREMVVLQALSEGKTPFEACTLANYAPRTVAARSVKISENVIRKSPMIAALDRRNVTTDRLAGVIAKGLDSKKVARLIIGGNVWKFDDPDHGARHRYLETALRLRGEDLDRQTISQTETFEQRIRRLRGLSPAT